MRGFFVGILAVIAMFCAQARPARAFQLSPATIEATIKPGEFVEKKFTIKNPEQNPVDLFLTVQKFVARGETGQQQFLDPTDVAGLPEWIRVSAPRVHLEANEQTTVDVRIAVPQKTEPGVYHAAVFFTERLSDAAELAQGMRIGSLLFVTVPGGRGAKLSLTQQIWNTQENKAHVSLKNTGDQDAFVTGVLQIKPFFGFSWQNTVLADQGARVLAGTTRTIEIPIKKRWWWIGWQHASLNIDGLPPQQATLFYGNWPIGLGSFGLPLLIAVSFIAKRRRRVRFGNHL